jgi:hypothetical protein
MANSAKPFILPGKEPVLSDEFERMFEGFVWLENPLYLILMALAAIDPSFPERFRVRGWEAVFRR